jgi:rod shape-determining protein MreD
VTPARGALLAAAVVAALVLQVTVVGRLPLPGSAPALLLVLVAAVGMQAGPGPGLVTGFGAGLLADLVGDAQLGREALVLALVGVLAGRAHGRLDRSAALPFLVVLGCAVLALLLAAAEALLLGDPRASWRALGTGLVSSAPYDAVLTPFVVPLVGLLVRRVEPDPLRRW